MPKLRSDQAAIYVAVFDSTEKNVLDSNVWASMEGGDGTATDTKTRSGGMGEEESLGGPKSRSNCTTTRQYTNDVLHPLVPKLDALRGSAAAQVAWKPLDADGNPDGDTHTITGRLIEVQTTKRDANGAEAMFLTLIISCHGGPILVS